MAGRLPKRASDPKDCKDKNANGNAGLSPSGQKCDKSCRESNYEYENQQALCTREVSEIALWNRKHMPYSSNSPA
jgi:hypothetical protein